jgi:hypothetical protein
MSTSRSSQGLVLKCLLAFASMSVWLSAVQPAFAEGCDLDGTCTYVANGGSSTITPDVAGQTFSPACAIVTNNNSLPIMVPHATQAEWNDASGGFISHLPAFVTVAACDHSCSTGTLTSNRILTVPTGGVTITRFSMGGGGGGGGAGGIDAQPSLVYPGGNGAAGGATYFWSSTTGIKWAVSGGTGGAAQWEGGGKPGGNGATVASSTSLFLPAGTQIQVHIGGGGGGGYSPLAGGSDIPGENNAWEDPPPAAVTYGEGSPGAGGGNEFAGSAGGTGTAAAGNGGQSWEFCWSFTNCTGHPQAGNGGGSGYAAFNYTAENCTLN